MSAKENELKDGVMDDSEGFFSARSYGDNNRFSLSFVLQHEIEHDPKAMK